MVTKETYFVQLGLKKNGRIVKNEQYSLDKLYNGIMSENEILSLNLAETAWMTKNKLFKTLHNKNKFIFDYANNFCADAELFTEVAIEHIQKLIKKDKEGKKNGKKKTI